MCRAVNCRSCGKTTWAGCGRHVDQVMAGVPASRQCTCSRETQGGTNPFSALVRRLRGR